MSAVARFKLPINSPPAIWAAFAAQGRWKNIVLVAQFVVITLLILVIEDLATRPPALVVVGEDGNGTYVQSTTATRALQDWLLNQQNKASDVTIRAFSERFMKATTAINSTTIDEAWAEATGLMVPPMAERMRKEAESQKLLETYRLAAIRTTLDFEALEVVERRGDKTHVRARVKRHKEKLVGGYPSDDVLQIDLVLLDVPRTKQLPDGLQVLDWRSGPYSPPVDGGTAAGTQ